MGTADNSSTAGGGTGSNTDASDVSGEANVVSATNNNRGGGVANQGNAAAVAATSLSSIPIQCSNYPETGSVFRG